MPTSSLKQPQLPVIWVNVTAGAGCSRKMAARIAELEDQAEQARIRAAKFEKDKVKLQVEIRDLSVELEAVNTSALVHP